ncbi:MAG: PH domain-containing protein [Oscillochloridaceae bacterium]|nr:PH domain-containing protein [Chloroflexaceae bacterium]MDW8391159.1 PH domain-containing protein [Oscillochloridaceae bacterium]
MRRWLPQRSWRLWLAMAACLATLVAGGYLLASLVALLTQPPELWPIDGRLFLRYMAALALLACAGLLAYRVAAALSLVYTLDRNGLYILWLGNRAVVPLGRIESVESGLNAPVSGASPFASIAYLSGLARLPEGRDVHRFSTVSLKRALIIHTPSEAYAISPRDVDGFVQDLEQRRRLGAVQQLAPGVETGRIFAYSFWRDPLARGGVLGAILLNLALLGVLMVLYPSLPPLIGWRSDATGAIVEMASRYRIFLLPLAGAAVLFLNVGVGLWLYNREPAGARMLQVTSALVQVLFGVAALTMLG